MTNNIVLSVKDADTIIAFTGSRTNGVEREMRTREEFEAFLLEGRERGITSYMCSSSMDFPEDDGMSLKTYHEITGNWRLVDQS